MACWRSPANTIDEDALYHELDDIWWKEESWATGFSKNQPDRSAKLELIAWEAEVTCHGQKEPFRYTLVRMEVKTLLKVYQKVRSMTNEGYKAVRILVKSKYQWPPGSEVIPASTQLSSSQTDAGSASKKHPRAETSSDRQQDQNSVISHVNTLTKGSAAGLFNYWRCGDRLCKNYHKACFVLGGKHFPLNTDLIYKWTKPIQIGEASIKRMPGDVLAGITYIEKKKTSKTDREQAMAADTTGIPIVINFGANVASSNVRSDIPRSSPPDDVMDDSRALTDYFQWLVDRGMLIEEHRVLNLAVMRKEGGRSTIFVKSKRTTGRI